jgi:prepilin-type N-terminal cleavage/methylation domain-containing protein/prepilin-type processing-associated H-X9-DG protein
MMRKAKKNRAPALRSPDVVYRDVEGFTLIELLIVIAIIALLMAILVPALSRAKEMGKRAVCLNQIKQVQLGWSLYVDDNDDKVPAADIGVDIGGGAPPYLRGIAWYNVPHTWNTNSNPTDGSTGAPHDLTVAFPNPKEVDWQHSIACGRIFRYIKNYKVYQCPVGEKGAYVTYTMSHAFNTWCEPPNGSAGPGSIARTVKRRSQIKRIGDRFVFLDEGGRGGVAFYMSYDRDNNPMKWYDPPPARHGMGTTFSFGDGHVEYRKWTDKHALAYIKGLADGSIDWGGQPGDNCDCDLRWVERGVWGDVPYDCTGGSRKCEF